MTEIPHYTSGYTPEKDDISTQAMKLQVVLEGIPLDPQSVNVAIDLFCGRGVIAAGELGLFPNAQVHAVDFRDHLVEFLKNEPRIHFHKGLVVDLLTRGILPKAPFVSISYAQERHGFTAQNIHLLHGIVGGYLFTAGDNLDNPLAYEDFFEDSFHLVKDRHIEQL